MDPANFRGPRGREFKLIKVTIDCTGRGCRSLIVKESLYNGNDRYIFYFVYIQVEIIFCPFILVG